MPLVLAPGITFCEVDGRRVFLDRGRDRYFALGAKADCSFTRLMAGTPADGDEARLRTLEHAGILAAAQAGAPPTACIAPPLRSSLLDERHPAAAPALATTRAAWLLHRAKRQVRRERLSRLCGAFCVAKTRSAASKIVTRRTELMQLAASFQTAARLVGALDQCLALSFALGRRALSYGYPVDLVLGVQGRPFQAHAWVQIGDVALSDRFDNIRPYTPILVL